MCELKRKTKRKTATIYKVVIKVGCSYYSYFAGTPILLGKVEPQTTVDYYRRCKLQAGLGHEYYKHGNPWFNEHMVGRTSGFSDRKAAVIFERQTIGGQTKILKMIIGGEIWEGSGDKVGEGLRGTTVFAGDEILSFKEI